MDATIDFSTSLAKIKSVDESLALIGIFLFVSTLLVVIGLAFDCWEDFEVVKNAIIGCFKHKSLDRLRYLDHKTRLAALGGGLITIGVAGELILEQMARSKETALQSANGNVIAFLYREASEARTRAVEIERENLRLRTALADRTLTNEQQRNIGEACSPLAGKTVFLQSYRNDLEADELIRQLIDALRLAHINAIDEHGKLEARWSSATTILGIQIIPVTPERSLAETLRKSLHDDGGLVVDDLTEFGTDVTDIQILVGTNPHKLLK
jgi:hypothetical protein